MATPGFEYNIKDNYTVTLLNKVGAEDRGSVEVTTGTIYTVNSIPDHNGKYTLKEILEYAELNSYDVITINIDYTFKECWFQIPENITLQAADGKTVKIELTNFEQAYYTSGASTYPIKTPIDSAGFYNYPRAAQINSIVMRLNSNNKYDNYSVAPTGERIIAMARRYWQLSPKGDCIVTNDGGFGANNQADYMNEDTVKITGITDVETENPRIEKSGGDPMGFSNFILIQTTTSYILKYSKTLTAIDGSVNIKTDGSQNFTGVEGWDIQSNLGGLYLATQDFLHLSYGKDENGDNISFVYMVDSSGALSCLFQLGNFVKKFYTKLITCESFSYYILNPDGSKTTLIHYFAGGSQIWHYNGTDWTLEQYTGIDNPTHALFFGTRKEYATTETRIIYYIVSDANKGLTEIWKRKDGKWTLTGKFTDKSYIPLISYYDGISDPENPVLKILFKDALTHNLYYYTNVQYTLSKGSRLNGVTIENKDAFTDLGQNNSGEDIYIRSMIKGADTGNIQDQLITYCTINAEDYNAVYSIWKIQNSIIKSDKNAMYYKGSYQPYFTGECRHNLIQANNWAVSLENDDDGIIYFGSVPLLHFKGADNTGDVIAVKNEGAMHKALKCYGVEGSSTTKISGAKSLYFNSADSDYAETQDKVDLSGDWTISFWVYYPTQTAYEVIFSTKENTIITTAKPEFSFYFGSFGNVLAACNDGSEGAMYLIDSPATQNVWRHIVFTKEGNTLYLYINNSLKDSDTTPYTFSNTKLILGAAYNNDSGVYERFSTNRIQDFRFYPYALSSTERNTIYFGSVPLLHFKGADNTGDVIAVKNEGAMHKALKCYGVEGSSTTKISGAKSLYFNSADSDYAETQDKVDLSGDWTISFWVYYPTQTAYEVIFSTKENTIITTAKPEFSFYFGSFGNVLAACNDGSEGAMYLIDSPATQNVWRHIVFTKEGNTLYLYINNSLKDSDTTPYTFSNTKLILGAAYNNDSGVYERFSTNRIQDFRFYPYALSSTERNTIYNSGNGTFERNTIYNSGNGTFNNFALNTYFHNNTIYSLNGISANSTLSGMFYGCIIDAKYNALYRNAEAKHGFDISESLINGNTNDITVNSDCIIDANPLFKSIQNGNFRLMSKAEGYPKDSKALLLVYNMTYGRYEDAGCYFVDYDNTGEDVDSFTLDNYIVDIGLSWEYPKKETIFDYKGNLVKNMGDRTRVISLLSQHGGIKLPVISMMEKLISINDTLRFYPFGGDGIPYMIDDSDESYIQIGELYFANSNISNGVLEVTTNTGYSLESGKWRGAWLSCVIGQFYIIDNDSDRMYLKVASDYSISPFADEEYLDCKVLYYYVKTADTIEYLNNIWYDKAQNGKFPTVKLYVVDSKEG